jgi:hypothetical protein
MIPRKKWHVAPDARIVKIKMILVPEVKGREDRNVE